MTALMSFLFSKIASPVVAIVTVVAIIFIIFIVFIVLVILIDHSHSKEIRKYEKERKVLETRIQYLAQENTIIRKQLTKTNEINYKIVTAIVN